MTMKVRLTLNIGSVDQRWLNLPKTTEGSVINVPDATADELIKRSWAVRDDGRSAAVGATTRAASPGVAEATPSREELEGMTVADLRDMARDRDVEHFSTLNKAELVDALLK